jgi:hypothetical protein
MAGNIDTSAERDELALTLRGAYIAIDSLIAERDRLAAENAKMREALEGCVMAHQTGSYDAACAAYEDAKVVLGMVPDPACDIAKEPSDDR